MRDAQSAAAVFLRAMAASVVQSRREFWIDGSLVLVPIVLAIGTIVLLPALGVVPPKWLPIPAGALSLAIILASVTLIRPRTTRTHTGMLIGGLIAAMLVGLVTLQKENSTIELSRTVAEATLSQWVQRSLEAQVQSLNGQFDLAKLEHTHRGFDLNGGPPDDPLTLQIRGTSTSPRSLEYCASTRAVPGNWSVTLVPGNSVISWDAPGAQPTRTRVFLGKIKAYTNSNAVVTDLSGTPHQFELEGELIPPEWKKDECVAGWLDETTRKGELHSLRMDTCAALEKRLSKYE
jgi:hypothetical protein